MIKRVEKSIEIFCSINTAFSFLSTFSNFPLWTSVSSVEHLSGDGGIGSRYAISTPTLLSKKTSTIEISQKTSPSHLAYKDLTLPFSNEIGFILSGTENNTTITMYRQVELGLAASLLTSSFVGPQVISEIEKLLEKLKLVLENTSGKEKKVTSETKEEEEEVIVHNPFQETAEETRRRFLKSNY